jgi:hypothetical protein
VVRTSVHAGSTPEGSETAGLRLQTGVVSYVTNVWVALGLQGGD